MINLLIGFVVAIVVACALVGIFIILFAKTTKEPYFMVEDRTDLDQTEARRIKAMGKIKDITI